jgi:hypothetical protein
MLARTGRSSIARTALAAGLAVLVQPLAAPAAARGSQPDAPIVSAASAAERYGALPMAFEPNMGQADRRVRYLTRGRGYAVFFTAHETVLALSGARPATAGAKAAGVEEERAVGAVLRLRCVGAAPGARVRASQPLEGRVNYLRGPDPSAWTTDVPTYGRVTTEGVYPGVDLTYYGRQGQLEYDFVVAPGADPGTIVMEVEGADSAHVDEQGDLVLEVGGAQLRQPRPVVYQPDGRGSRRAVSGGYAVEGANRVRFALGAYDVTRAVVIDPVLVYSTYLGGETVLGGNSDGKSIAVDASGQVFVTGQTTAIDFPATPGAFDTTYSRAFLGDAFVTKLSSAGSGLVYSTYLGGTDGSVGAGVAVDASGAAYVTGETRSSDFPTTPGALDTTFNGGLDAFVLKLNAAGSGLVYSTFLGRAANDSGAAVAVDATGAAYVTGDTDSPDFPTTPGAFDITFNEGPIHSSDAFVTKVNAAGSGLAYSTFLGGTYSDFGIGIAVDAAGAAYVSGTTGSSDFPTTPGAFDTTFNGNGTSVFGEVFVAKLISAGSGLVYSTYLGGTDGDSCAGVAVDAAGAAYVTGKTTSPDFPTTPGAFDTTYAGGFGSDAFVTKVNAAGSGLVYSTFLGGTDNDNGADIAVDGSGRACVTGAVVASSISSGSNFPTTPGAFDTTFNHGFGGGSDAFVTKLSVAGSGLVYSTFLGGSGTDSGAAIAVDATGAAYVTGATGSSNFPTTAGAFDTTFNGIGASDSDTFVTKVGVSGSALGYSTFLGGVFTIGSGSEGLAIAVDASGAAYVTGQTTSPDFPTTPGAFDTTFDGGIDVFVTKLSSSGSGLVYSTYIGGTGGDYCYGVAVDATGAAYVTGSTASSNFPTTPGAFDTTFDGGGSDAFVTKLNASGSGLVYSTYIGGTGNDDGTGIAVDATGAAYVTGGTSSGSGFPTTPGAFDTTLNSSDAFVTKLNATGSALVYSTLLGGTGGERGVGVAVDAGGAAHVVGGTLSPDFPTTPGAFDTTFNGGISEYGDAFVAKLNATGSGLVHSTFLGGNSAEDGFGIAVDASGAAYVTGHTTSPDFPTTPGAFDTTYDAGPPPFTAFNVFVTKLNAEGSGLAYSTFVGIAIANGIAVDASGAAYVVGTTNVPTFPTTPDAFDPTLNGSFDAFVTQLSPSGDALGFSTFLGGAGEDQGLAIALGPLGVHVTGSTVSLDFPTATPVQAGLAGSRDAFVFLLSFGNGPAGGTDTAGAYIPSTGVWFLRNQNAPGAADLAFGYGPSGSGWLPLQGDWNGDGVETPGLYVPTTGAFFLKNASAPGAADLVFVYGGGGLGLVPLTGDWDGDGVTTVGLYVPSTGTFFLTNTNAPGPADIVFTFGAGDAGLVPLSGDWDGDGVTTVGLYAPESGAFFLRNEHAGGGADVVFAFGAGEAGVVPITGDWDGDGDDTIGLYAPSTSAFFLKNANAGGAADLVFSYGPPGATPIVGNWDGQ